VATALLTVAGAGDHIVSSTHIYEGTRGLFLDNLARLDIETTFVDDIADADAWRAAIRPNTRALFAESLANARNDVLDVRAISDVGDEHAIPLIVDNTLATPALLRPLEHGAAIAVHSASKFLAGHGSVLGGVIIDDGRFDAALAGHNAPPSRPPRAGGMHPASSPATGAAPASPTPANPSPRDSAHRRPLSTPS
jgi:O-acetylhomoserine (thiol)-lyase